MDKPTCKTHQFAINPSAKNDSQDSSTTKTSYYDVLRKALEEARSQVGDELTEWRNFVGKKELNKEPRKRNGDDDEEEEEG